MDLSIIGDAGYWVVQAEGEAYINALVKSDLGGAAGRDAVSQYI